MAKFAHFQGHQPEEGLYKPEGDGSHGKNTENYSKLVQWHKTSAPDSFETATCTGVEKHIELAGGSILSHLGNTSDPFSLCVNIWFMWEGGRGWMRAARRKSMLSKCQLNVTEEPVRRSSTEIRGHTQLEQLILTHFPVLVLNRRA